MTPTEAAKAAAIKLMEVCLAPDLTTSDAAFFDALTTMHRSPHPDRTSSETMFLLANVASQMAVWRSGINDIDPKTVARDLVDEACEELGLEEEDDA